MCKTRATSAVIATAVYHPAVAKGVATETPDHVVQVVQAILDTMWLPAYED